MLLRTSLQKNITMATIAMVNDTTSAKNYCVKFQVQSMYCSEDTEWESSRPSTLACEVSKTLGSVKVSLMFDKFLSKS